MHVCAETGKSNWHHLRNCKLKKLMDPSVLRTSHCIQLAVCEAYNTVHHLIHPSTHPPNHPSHLLTIFSLLFFNNSHTTAFLSLWLMSLPDWHCVNTPESFRTALYPKLLRDDEQALERGPARGSGWGWRSKIPHNCSSRTSRAPRANTIWKSSLVQVQLPVQVPAGCRQGRKCYLMTMKLY